MSSQPLRHSFGSIADWIHLVNVRTAGRRVADRATRISSHFTNARTPFPSPEEHPAGARTRISRVADPVGARLSVNGMQPFVPHAVAKHSCRLCPGATALFIARTASTRGRGSDGATVQARGGASKVSTSLRRRSLRRAQSRQWSILRPQSSPSGRSRPSKRPAAAQNASPPTSG